MTVKTVSGTYSSGYALHSPTTTLSITASGYVGGAGISVHGSGAYTVVNMGTVRGYSARYFWQEGINLVNGGSVTNGSEADTRATISGQSDTVIVGAGGAVTNFGTITEASDNEPEYAGILLSDGGTITNGSESDSVAMVTGVNSGVIVLGAAGSVTNFGTISGASGYAIYLESGGIVTNGSTSDSVASISNRVRFNDVGTLRNFGRIGYDDEYHAAINMQATASNILTNGSQSDSSALIYGPIEMGGGTLTNYGSISPSVLDTYAVVGTNGPLTVRNLGKIIAYFDAGNRGGIGAIELMNGGNVVNGSSTDHTALISGNVGIKLDGAGTVTNFGTIHDEYEDASVIFTSVADRFVAEAGSTTVGTVLGGGGTFELASGSGTITNLGVSAIVSGSVSTTAEDFGTYLLDAGTSWTFRGTNTLDATQNLKIAGAATLLSKLDVLGTLTVTGSIAGSGTLTVAGGETMIDAGAVIRVDHWATSGGTVVLEESLAYSGVFEEAADGTLTLLTGSRLSLTGTTGLHGTINGTGVVAVHNAEVGGLVIGGTDSLSLNGTVSQSVTVTLGDSASSTATIRIQDQGVWEIGPGSIVKGAGRGVIRDFGLLIKDAGTGVSTIGATTYDDGTIEVATGTLDFTTNLFGTGALKLDAGATLEADRSAVDTLTVDFTGADATLAMRFASNFAATIGGFAASDTLDLLKTKATSASVNAKDQLVILNGKTVVATLQLAGSYAGDTFSVGSDGNGGTDITIAAGENAQAPPQMPQAPSPHLLVAAMAAMGATAGGVVATHDVFANHAPTLSRPASQMA